MTRVVLPSGIVNNLQLTGLFHNYFAKSFGFNGFVIVTGIGSKTKKSAQEAATILKKETFDDARVMHVDPKKGHIVRGEKALDL